MSGSHSLSQAPVEASAEAPHAAEPAAAAAAPAASGHARSDLFDGLRGLAIILVLLHHTWIIAPVADIESDAARRLLAMGNYAVSLFLVLGGFLAARSMLRTHATSGTLRFGVVTIRRWLRLAPQVYALILVLALLTALDPWMDIYDTQNLPASARAVATFTWLGYLRTHIDSRTDLGHLWYVSADLWGIALVAFIIYLTARWRPGLVMALVGLIAFSMWFRSWSVVHEVTWVTMLRFEVRVDSLLWGALAAAILPWLEPLRGRITGVAATSLALMAPLLFWGATVPNYLGIGATFFNILAFTLVLGVSLEKPGRILSAWLGSRVLVWMGGLAFTLYVWHYPIWFYIGQNFPRFAWPGDGVWPWGLRVAFGYALAFAVALLARRVIDPRAQQWLDSPRWRELDAGLLPFLGSRPRVWWSRWRHQGARRNDLSPAAADAEAVAPLPAAADPVQEATETLTRETHAPEESGPQESGQQTPTH